MNRLAAPSVGAGTVNSIVINDTFGDNRTTLTFSNGAPWTRGTGGTLLFDTSSSPTAVVNVSGSPSDSGANNVLGYALIKDNSGNTNLAAINSSNQIVALTSFATLLPLDSATGSDPNNDYATGQDCQIPGDRVSRNGDRPRRHVKAAVQL